MGAGIKWKEIDESSMIHTYSLFVDCGNYILYHFNGGLEGDEKGRK